MHLLSCLKFLHTGLSTLQSKCISSSPITLLSCKWWKSQINTWMMVSLWHIILVRYLSPVLLFHILKLLWKVTLYQRKGSWILIQHQYVIHLRHIKQGGLKSPYRIEKAVEFTSWQATIIQAVFNFMLFCLILPELLLLSFFVWRLCYTKEGESKLLSVIYVTRLIMPVFVRIILLQCYAK